MTHTEWRKCTIRSGQITNITDDIIAFTEDYSGSSKSVSYSFSGADLKLIWDDGEIYTMTTVTGLPYPEDDAVSSPCFN